MMPLATPPPRFADLPVPANHAYWADVMPPPRRDSTTYMSGNR